MHSSPFVPTANMSGKQLVSSALARLTSRDTISTKALIQTVRWTCPECHETDDDLLKIIVEMAKDRAMAIVFDHRDHPEPVPIRSMMPDNTTGPG